MAAQSPSMVRSAALRRSAFSLAKAFSIGLKFWTVGRQVEQRRSGGLDQRSHAWPLVARQVVHDHHVS